MAVANADGQRLHHQEESYAAALRTVERLTLAAVVAGVIHTDTGIALDHP